MGMTLQDILDCPRTGRAVVMGILNVTPDSFSDGGQFADAARALDHAQAMLADGAAVIDVGAESTRPGAPRVPPAEQIRRLKDILPALARTGAVLSIDTTHAAVAAFALDCGAAIVNDISAGREDPDLLPLAARSGAAVVLMHMQGDPQTMQQAPQYKDVVGQVRQFLAERLDAAQAAGVPGQRCILDAGIGFGKRLEHNLALLAGTGELVRLGSPVLVGVSRKRCIGELTGQDQPGRRVSGTVSACLACRARGATIFRVHDVRELADALAVWDAIESVRPPSSANAPRAQRPI